jgi:hypothetical protein
MDECTGPAVARCYVRSSMRFSRYPKKHAAWKTKQSWQKYLPGKCDQKREQRMAKRSKGGGVLSSVPLVRQRDARGTVTYLSERTYDR